MIYAGLEAKKTFYLGGGAHYWQNSHRENPSEIEETHVKIISDDFPER